MSALGGIGRSVRAFEIVIPGVSEKGRLGQDVRAPLYRSNRASPVQPTSGVYVGRCIRGGILSILKYPGPSRGQRGIAPRSVHVDWFYGKGSEDCCKLSNLS